MENGTPEALVKHVLKNPFNQDGFAELVRQMLNYANFSKEKQVDQAGAYIYKPFRDHINRFWRIAQYDAPDDKLLDVLVVQLKEGLSLERARTMQRNFVAMYLNKGRQGGRHKHAALVAFIPPDKGGDWRFSFVKMEYELDDANSPVEKLTPARRYSFLVGKGENCHTAQSMLLPLLQNDEQRPTLQQIEDAFSVGPVTEEFFEQYQKCYGSLVSALGENQNAVRHFEDKDIDIGDFSIKLMGQIVFLYFLQKKGWFGVEPDAKWGTGSKGFLRELFKGERRSYKNFYSDILEPLFYNALRYKRDGDYYDFFNCRIPFLNGGLFDPIDGYEWEEVRIELPDHIFSNERKNAAGDEGTGILDVFDRYNFTAKEDEPLEKDVAVDPEILGKVFESLLATEDRKRSGTFYTPREIVHHMCKQSLTQYLATELGEDATLEGIETLIKDGEVVLKNDSMRTVREKGKMASMAHLPPEVLPRIDEKLASIRVCDPAVGSGAFPVGMMQEIVRLRMALAPYMGKGESDAKMSYDFKRHAIHHCLYGVDVTASAVDIAKLRLWLSLIVDEDDLEKIEPLPNLDYKIVQGDSLLSITVDLWNLDLANELDKKIDLHFGETDPVKKEEYRVRIDEIISELTGGHEKFSFHVNFSRIFRQKDGFDVVIGNPPYVKKEHLSEKTIKDLEGHYKWSDDLYIHFIFQGMEVTRQNGFITYIANDSFVALSSKKRARSLLLENNLQTLIKCPLETFRATIYTAIFAAQKAKDIDGVYQAGRFSYPEFQYESLGAVSIDLVKVLPNQRFVVPSPTLSICEKMLSHKKVKDALRVLNAGIHSGNVRLKIFFKEQGREGLSPLLQGRQIERWGVFWNRPNAQYKYCDIGYQPLCQKGTGRKGKQSKLNEYWHFCADIKYHHQPERLLMRQSDDDLVVAYHSEDVMGRFYTDNTLYTILPACEDISLKYAMAILNSKLLNVVYQFLSQEKGKTLAQIKTNLVKELPFAIGNQQPFIALVDEILAITASDGYLQNEGKKEQVRQYEREIDTLVYQLYGLDADDIAIIEAASASKSGD